MTERPSRLGAATLARFRPAGTQGHRHLLTGSAVLVVGAAIQALSGAVFWLIAARLDAEEVVGAGGKLFTSVLFVTYLAGLGLPVSLARYAAGRDPDSDTTFTWAVLATVVSSLVFGFAYVGLLHGSATGLLTDVNPVLGPLLFAVIVVGAALSLIVDVRCMTARRWNLVLVRISLVGLVRFPLLFMFQHVSDHQRSFWLFVAATGPMAVSGLIGALWVPRVADGRHRLGPKPARTDAAIRYSAVNYVSTLAYQAPYFLLPVIVLANVSNKSYASFNVAWGIVAVAFYVPTAIGQALLAEGGKDGARVHHQLRLAMWLALTLMIAGTIITFLGSGVITSVYGAEYEKAAEILPAMVAAGIPWAVTSLYLSEVRILHRHLATVAITAALTIGIVGPALVLVPDSGLDGAKKAWLYGNIAAAVVAIVAVQISRARNGLDPVLSEPGTAEDAAEVGIELAEHL